MTTLEKIICERCFDYIDEVSLDSPYDADYESERYYKHEDHMQIDESYARSKHMCKEKTILGNMVSLTAQIPFHFMTDNH
jgi:hypothetical protein